MFANEREKIGVEYEEERGEGGGEGEIAYERESVNGKKKIK